MRQSLLAAAVILAPVLALGASTVAQGSVVGSVSDSDGTAGYYTHASGVRFTQADATVTLNKPALQYLSSSPATGGDGAIGTQLCNSVTGFTAEVGVIPSPSDPGTWEVVVARGLSAGGPAPIAPCDGNVLLSAHLRHTVLGELPAGSTVQVQIMVVRLRHHFVLRYTVADSQLVNFDYEQRSRRGHFNQAGDGVTGDLNLLSAPAINDLADFRDVTATTAGRDPQTHGLAYWNAVSVASGVPGYAPLITPGAITPNGFSCRWHRGHWRRWTTTPARVRSATAGGCTATAAAAAADRARSRS